MPFIDTAETAGILGEPHATVDRALTDLLADGIVGRVSHGIAHLPSSQRDYVTANGIGEAASPTGRRSGQTRTVSGIRLYSANLSRSVKVLDFVKSGGPTCTVDRTEASRGTFSVARPAKKLSSGIGTV